MILELAAFATKALSDSTHFTSSISEKRFDILLQKYDNANETNDFVVFEAARLEQAKILENYGGVKTLASHLTKILDRRLTNDVLSGAVNMREQFKLPVVDTMGSDSVCKVLHIEQILPEETFLRCRLMKPASLSTKRVRLAGSCLRRRDRI